MILVSGRNGIVAELDWVGSIHGRIGSDRVGLGHKICVFGWLSWSSLSWVGSSVNNTIYSYMQKTDYSRTITHNDKKL